MSDNPIPYIQSLKRESDGFANGLHCAALIPAFVFAGWFLLSHFGWTIDAPVSLGKYVRYAMGAWLIFFGLCAIVDYTIFAVFRSITEWLDAMLTKFTLAQAQVEAEALNVAVGEFSKPSAAPEQRDSAVAYLHDFIKRTRQVTDDSDPLPPTPPVAA